MFDFIVAHWKMILVICLYSIVLVLNIIIFILNRKSNKHLNNASEILIGTATDLDFKDVLKYLYAVVPEAINMAEETNLSGTDKLKLVVENVKSLAVACLGRALDGKELDVLYDTITNFVELVLSTPQKKS